VSTERLAEVRGALRRIPFDARTQLIGLLGLIGYCGYQAVLAGSSAADWDLRTITAFALLLIAVRAAPRVTSQLDRALKRLHDRGVFSYSERGFECLVETLALRRRRWGPIWGLATGLLIVVAFFLGWRWLTLADGWRWVAVAGEPFRLALLLVELPLLYAVGNHIGSLVMHGGLSGLLRRQGIRSSVLPGHPDGAAGLKPLGDFFFHQALIAGLPAAYVAAWLALVPHHPATAGTIALYLQLLPVFLLIEVAAFVWPMWCFHRAMLRQKRALAAKADEVWCRISGIRAELEAFTNRSEFRTLSSLLRLELEHFDALEHLPTWPVSREVRRWFAIQNLILVTAPLLGFLGEGRERIGDALKTLLGG